MTPLSPKREKITKFGDNETLFENKTAATILLQQPKSDTTNASPSHIYIEQQ